MIKNIIKFMSTVIILSFAGTFPAQAGKPCKSQAYDKATAIEFCSNKLKCENNTPPEQLECKGKPRRWICKCVSIKNPSPTPSNKNWLEERQY